MSKDERPTISLPQDLFLNVTVSEKFGHRLHSQGCCRFRCEYCNRADFLDEPGVQTNNWLMMPCMNIPAEPTPGGVNWKLGGGR